MEQKFENNKKIYLQPQIFQFASLYYMTIVNPELEFTT